MKNEDVHRTIENVQLVEYLQLLQILRSNLPMEVKFDSESSSTFC